MFLKVRSRVVDTYDSLQDAIEDQIRSFAKSPFLDEPDEDSFQRTDKLRKFLKSQKALAPGVGPKVARSKTRGRR